MLTEDLGYVTRFTVESAKCSIIGDKSCWTGGRKITENENLDWGYPKRNGTRRTDHQWV